MIKRLALIIFVSGCGQETNTIEAWDKDRYWECSEDSSCVDNYSCIPKWCFEDRDIDTAISNTPEGSRFTTESIQRCSDFRFRASYGSGVIHNGVCSEMCGGRPCLEPNVGWDYEGSFHTYSSPYPRTCDDDSCMGDNEECISTSCLIDTNIPSDTVAIDYQNNICEYATINIRNCNWSRLNMLTVGPSYCFEMCDGKPCDIEVNSGWDAEGHWDEQFSCY